MLKQVMDIFEILDDPAASGQAVKDFFAARGFGDCVEVQTLNGPKGTTDFVRIIIRGENGKLSGGTAPTLGVTGRLGGLGARPEMIGFVSDGDGALTAISAALKLCEMKKKGDVLPGDVIVTTHVCPNAPTSPHFPTPFMGSPVEMETINRLEVEMDVDAVLSADTTKGNKIICKRGFAISCPVKEGYILKASDDLVEIMSRVTGQPAAQCGYHGARRRYRHHHRDARGWLCHRRHPYRRRGGSRPLHHRGRQGLYPRPVQLLRSRGV